MTQADALNKLISVRHYCFMRGILGRVPSDQPLNEEVTEKKLASFLSGCEPKPGSLIPGATPDPSFENALADVNRLYTNLKNRPSTTAEFNQGNVPGRVAA
jgi:hypothetical protein